MKFSLIIVALNEIDGMRVILPRIRREWVDEILVVDGGSTDGTSEYAEAQGYRVVRQKSKGLTNAYWEGLAAATGDVIIPFSPDGNSVPERIPELVSKMKEGYDMVIVSRYCEGAKSEDDDPITALGNWVFTQTINFLFGGRYTDTLVMFRAWRKELVDRFGLFTIYRPVVEPLLCILCAKYGLRVGEIPGDEPKRIEGGTRKMRPLINGLTILEIVVKEFFRPRRQVLETAPLRQTP